jgi:hypothetical protein
MQGDSNEPLPYSTGGDVYEDTLPSGFGGLMGKDIGGLSSLLDFSPPVTGKGSSIPAPQEQTKTSSGSSGGKGGSFLGDIANIVKIGAVIAAKDGGRIDGYRKGGKVPVPGVTPGPVTPPHLLNFAAGDPFASFVSTYGPGVTAAATGKKNRGGDKAGTGPASMDIGWLDNLVPNSLLNNPNASGANVPSYSTIAPQYTAPGPQPIPSNLSAILGDQGVPGFAGGGFFGPDLGDSNYDDLRAPTDPQDYVPKGTPWYMQRPTPMDPYDPKKVDMLGRGVHDLSKALSPDSLTAQQNAISNDLSDIWGPDQDGSRLARAAKSVLPGLAYGATGAANLGSQVLHGLGNKLDEGVTAGITGAGYLADQVGKGIGGIGGYLGSDPYAPGKGNFYNGAIADGTRVPTPAMPQGSPLAMAGLSSGNPVGRPRPNTIPKAAPPPAPAEDPNASMAERPLSPSELSKGDPGGPSFRDTSKDGTSKEGSSSDDWFARWRKSPWALVMDAGLRTMAGQNPNALVNIGQGVSGAVSDYDKTRRADAEQKAQDLLRQSQEDHWNKSQERADRLEERQMDNDFATRKRQDRQDAQKDRELNIREKATNPLGDLFSNPVPNAVNPIANSGAKGPIRVTSIQEAQKLPKGTRFLDPNGVERVR